MKIRGELPPDALRTLRRLPGFEALTANTGVLQDSDAMVTAGGQDHRLMVATRARVDGGAARRLTDQLVAPHHPLLVIADETTEAARTLLREAGVAYVDGDGHAHIELPGVLVHLDGAKKRPRAARSTPTPRLNGKAGVIAQALLLQPDRAWKIADLANVADVSTGLAHRVVTRLEQAGLLTAHGAGPHRTRRVAEPAALLDQWVEEQVDRPHRTAAHQLAPNPAALLQTINEGLFHTDAVYAITGAAGAGIVAPFATAIPVIEVWIDAHLDPIGVCETVGAEPVPRGHNVVFLQDDRNTPLAFRELVNGVWLTNRFRLYLDLYRSRQRGPEQAEHLRRTIIGF